MRDYAIWKEMERIAEEYLAEGGLPDELSILELRDEAVRRLTPEPES